MIRPSVLLKLLGASLVIDITLASTFAWVAPKAALALQTHILHLVHP